MQDQEENINAVIDTIWSEDNICTIFLKYLK